MIKASNKYIKKALKHYQYDKEIDFTVENSIFYHDYLRRLKYFGGKKSQSNFKYFYNHLIGFGNINHIAAKNLLFQGDVELAGKYFSRTAFWGVVGNTNSAAAEYIDYYTDYLDYALYTEDKKTILLALDMITWELEKADAKTKEYKNQEIYPKTYFLHFLIEKWLGENLILPRLFNEFFYKGGYGIYQTIIDHWNDLSILPDSYWDDLCEYHLNGMSLYGSAKREKEQFLLEGIVPMELLNLIKVRRKLGLDIPEFKHELFLLPTSIELGVPTGYDPSIDVLYQLIKLTAENKRPYSIEEVVSQLKKLYGDNINVFI